MLQSGTRAWLRREGGLCPGPIGQGLGHVSGGVQGGLSGLPWKRQPGRTGEAEGEEWGAKPSVSAQ